MTNSVKPEKNKPFAPKFAPPRYGDANGKAALALTVSLLDVLVRKTGTLKEGEVSIIINDALRYLPQSPVLVDETARELVSALMGKIRKSGG